MAAAGTGAAMVFLSEVKHSVYSKHAFVVFSFAF
jgi:hypothetical protein